MKEREREREKEREILKIIYKYHLYNKLKCLLIFPEIHLP
jgi:hypothetical protein